MNHWISFSNNSLNLRRAWFRKNIVKPESTIPLGFYQNTLMPLERRLYVFHCMVSFFLFNLLLTKTVIVCQETVRNQTTVK